MNPYLRLNILGILLLTQRYTIGEDHPVLSNVFSTLNIGESEERVKQDYQNTLEVLKDQFEYYRTEEMTVNQPLNAWLLETVANLPHNSSFEYPSLGPSICGQGNRGGPITFTDGPVALCNEADRLLSILSRVTGPDDMALVCFEEHTHRLGFLDKLLSLLDVFVTSQVGKRLGLPEFPQNAVVDLPEPPEPDFSLPVDGLECNSDETCLCGCQFEHAIEVIEGMEDFFQNRQSRARHYFEGTALANNIKLHLVTGNEGPAFDAIKELGKKAWETLTVSFKALSDSITGGEDEDKVAAASETVDANKKLFQAMKSTPAHINENAEASMAQLAENIDQSGKVKAVVMTVKKPTDAPDVLDKLLGIMTKAVSSGGDIKIKLAEANKTLSELKTATDAASKGDEDNKEVVATNKEAVQDKIAEAKEALKAVKAELKTHNRFMSGMKKLITGLSPKIFIAEGDNKDD